VTAVYELIALAGFVGLDADLDVAVLALAAGLADIAGVDVCRLADGLLVGDLRLADVGLHLELAEQSVDDDLQVKLAHAGDDGLSGLLIGIGGRSGPPQPAWKGQCPSSPGRPWSWARWRRG
jgi:hypothetical protein